MQGSGNYKSFIVDLSQNKSEIKNLKSEIIIADVPCSGSGTWSRTPEQLYFFQESKIEEYSALQKRIVSNVIAQLQPGGSFVYITCSVFKKENEEVAMYIKENFHLQLKQMEVLKGYDKKLIRCLLQCLLLKYFNAFFICTIVEPDDIDSAVEFCSYTKSIIIDIVFLSRYRLCIY